MEMDEGKQGSRTLLAHLNIDIQYTREDQLIGEQRSSRMRSATVSGDETTRRRTLLFQKAAGANVTPEAAAVAATAVALMAAPIHIHSIKLHKKLTSQEDDLQ